jgi:hypothetical protein
VDPGDLGGVQADRDELEKRVVLADHAERAEPRVHQVDGRLDDPPQGRLEIEVGADGDDRL